MKKRGITQRELSKIIRVNQPTISRWFNGQEPYSKALHKLSDFFHVSIYLLESDDLTEKEFESKLYNSITIYPLKEKLRIIILRKNLTQGEFAKIAGISHRGLTAWLSGIKPHPRNVKKIAERFNVNIKSLLDDSLPLQFLDDVTKTNAKRINANRLLDFIFPTTFQTFIKPEIITGLNRYGILHGNQNAIEASKYLALLSAEFSTQKEKYEKD